MSKRFWRYGAVNRKEAIEMGKKIIKHGRMIAINKDGSMVYDHAGKVGIVKDNGNGDLVLITVVKSNKHIA